MNLWRKLKENKTLEIIFAGVLALVLLLAIYMVFFKKDDTKNVSQQVNMTDTEKKLCSLLCSIEGVNNVNAYINEAEGEIRGVVLVIDGEKSLSLRMDIMQATASALNVNQKIIQIYEMK